MSGAQDQGPTHRDLAQALGVSVTTIKSYRRKFPEFFQEQERSKPLRFHPEAGALCARIRQLFGRGLGVEAVRERLGQEFPAAPESSPAAAPSPVSTASPQPQSLSQVEQPDRLARMETLLEGLFSLQNRTHSLLAELVSRLDTLADRLEPPAPPRGNSPERATIPATERPPEALLDRPVVVLSDSGEYLGVNGPGGRPCSLAQFQAFLLERGRGQGLGDSRWLRLGEQWVLRLGSGGQAHEHFFREEVTPRGNAVARFASLSVGGQPVTDAALQDFLRQVRDSLPR